MNPSYYTRIGNWRFASFYLFATIGVVLSFVSTLTISLLLHVPIRLFFLFTLLSYTSVLVFYALQYIASGKRELVFYRYMVFIILWDMLFFHLFSIKQPLKILDIVVIGIGIVQCSGRFGCFHAGCCYGRPWHHGVLYNQQHVAKGFPTSYTNYRIFPVQLISSACILIAVITATTLLFHQAPTGSACSTYIVLYGFFRYFIEFIRGDVSRPFLVNISEAQWTALAMSVLVTTFELSGLLALNTIHIIMSSLLAGASALIVCASFIPRLHVLLSSLLPFQQTELINCLYSLKGKINNTSEISMIDTKSGTLISLERLYEEETVKLLYTCSNFQYGLTERNIRCISRLLVYNHPNDKKKLEIIRRSKHLVHICIV